MHINFNSKGVRVVDRRETKLKPWQGVIFGLFFLIMGGIVGAMCFKQIEPYKEKKENFIKIQADVVTYVDEFDHPYTQSSYYGDEDQRWWRVIEYEVKGVKYTKKDSSFVDSIPSVITPITIYYNPDNPQDIIYGDEGSPLMGVIIGGVFALAGAIIIIKSIISGKNGEEYV